MKLFPPRSSDFLQALMPFGPEVRLVAFSETDTL